MNESQRHNIEAAVRAIDNTASICIHSSKVLFSEMGLQTSLVAMINIKDYCNAIREYLQDKEDKL